MALDGLETAVFASVGSSRSIHQKLKLHVIRYADDWVVTSSSREILEQQVLPAIQKFMASRGLELSQEKTKITHIAKGFDFLGQNIRKYKDKLLIKPAGKSIKALLDKIREIIKRSTSATQTALIQKLNPIIRGWAQYHRHVVAKATFAFISHAIWQLLWKWAKRRHPSKGAHWIKHKYFQRVENQDWVFTARERSSKETCTTTLFNAASLPIVRHVKIRQLANPFDPQWRNYFIQRRNTTRFLYCPVP